MNDAKQGTIKTFKIQNGLVSILDKIGSRRGARHAWTHGQNVNSLCANNKYDSKPNKNINI